MNCSEYENIKHFTYIEYCDYLQKKHGIGKYDYMTKSWNKNTKCTRTKEGLIAHHKYENCAIMLSKKEIAMSNPFEWQLAKNIVYCDYLEHLLLHVLICEHPSEEKNDFEAVGIGGVINFIVPELNDFYSGWITKLEWQKKCHDLIKGNKDVYLTIIKRIKISCKNNPFFSDDCLFKSFNEQYGLWSSTQNKLIYNDIKSL
jgi:hypothetical protein